MNKFVYNIHHSPKKEQTDKRLLHIHTTINLDNLTAYIT